MNVRNVIAIIGQIQRCLVKKEPADCTVVRTPRELRVIAPCTVLCWATFGKLFLRSTAVWDKGEWSGNLHYSCQPPICLEEKGQEPLPTENVAFAQANLKTLGAWAQSLYHRRPLVAFGFENRCDRSGQERLLNFSDLGRQY